ncbi:M20 family metallopeptidase [Agromyces laixinhei]|uniref:M20 family metallopeptidase n=1 Tax=Agromyces laixinhei TaxID=2585717 RepID=UPI0012EEC663|nr:M20 family metallopeptidase [Agromyces laixinhei]
MSTHLSEALALIDEATVVADTSSLIVAASENPGGTEILSVRMLEGIASRLGMRTKRQNVAPGRPNLSITAGPDAPGILFLGHSDVVPGGEGWTGGPFTPRVIDGAIVGRGAADMKGGLAAVLQAMGAVTAVRPDIPMELLVTVDEEDLATGALAHLESVAPKPYWACVVAEPTNLAAVVACRGAANFEIEVQGRAAHAGRPEEGLNAILIATRIIEAIDEDHRSMRASASGRLGSGTWNIGRIDGGHGTSIVPDRCTLLLDRRLMPGERAADVLTWLEQATALECPEGATVTVRTLMEMPGFDVPDTHPLVTHVVDSLVAEQHEAIVEAWSAACEGGFMHSHHGMPTVVFGPGDILGQAHQPDESVPIADLAVASRAYARLAIAVADDPECTRGRTRDRPSTTRPARTTSATDPQEVPK